VPWEPATKGDRYTYRPEADWSSEAGARTQAADFRAYWRLRGVDVATTLVCTGPADNEVWGFRSDFKPFHAKGRTK
jgi:hypothetical protein